jgi:hypothetical protein
VCETAKNQRRFAHAHRFFWVQAYSLSAREQSNDGVLVIVFARDLIHDRIGLVVLAPFDELLVAVLGVDVKACSVDNKRQHIVLGDAIVDDVLVVEQVLREFLEDLRSLPPVDVLVDGVAEMLPDETASTLHKGHCLFEGPARLFHHGLKHVAQVIEDHKGWQRAGRGGRGGTCHRGHQTKKRSTAKNPRFFYELGASRGGMLRVLVGFHGVLVLVHGCECFRACSQRPPCVPIGFGPV